MLGRIPVDYYHAYSVVDSIFNPHAVGRAVSRENDETREGDAPKMS
jgi:hypothetical protein